MTAADTREHTIRFARSGNWRCTCGGFGRSKRSAEIHAHATAGRIEMGGR